MRREQKEAKKSAGSLKETNTKELSKANDAIRKLRRIGQKVGNPWEIPEQQQEIIRKLYKKKGLTIIMTCGACPEQYDVYNDKEFQVAYLRLRHGEFSVRIGGAGGRFVLEAEPIGDGQFTNTERLVYMKKALDAIVKNIEGIVFC